VKTWCSSSPYCRWHAVIRVTFLVSSVLPFALIANSRVALSETVAPDTVLQFDIPRQSLASALDRYSATTGIVGLYQGRLTIGRVSKTVAGRFTPAAALALLLHDSGLRAEYAAADAFAIVAAPGVSPAMKPVNAVARAGIIQQDAIQQGYSALLQEKISDALCGSTLTRPGDYRVALNFGVGPAGGVEHFNLLGSSGDDKRDDAIFNALQSLVIGRPAPAHMPQPFTIVVLPISSGGIVDCRPTRSAGRNG
jgi:hypothetical protein